MKKFILTFVFALVTIFSFGQTLDTLAKSLQESEYTYTYISFNNNHNYVRDLVSFFILKGSDKQECAIFLFPDATIPEYNIQICMPPYNEFIKKYYGNLFVGTTIYMSKNEASYIIEILNKLLNNKNYEFNTNLLLYAHRNFTNKRSRIKLEVIRAGNNMVIRISPIGNGSDLLYQFWYLTKSDINQINYTLTKYVEYLNNKYNNK